MLSLETSKKMMDLELDHDIIHTVTVVTSYIALITIAILSIFLCTPSLPTWLFITYPVSTTTILCLCCSAYSPSVVKLKVHLHLHEDRSMV